MWYKHPVYTDYSCDEEGNILNTRTGRTVKQTPRGDGYLAFSARKGKNDRRTYASHRFIWECLNGSIIPEGYQTDHINANRSDNRSENLRLTTPRGNSRNPRYLKLRREIASRPGRKSTVPVVVTYKGIPIARYSSMRECARSNNLPFSTLWCRVANGSIINEVEYVPVIDE